MLTVCRTFTLTPTTNFPLNRVVLTHRKLYVLRKGKWHHRTDTVQSLMQFVSHIIAINPHLDKEILLHEMLGIIQDLGTTRTLNSNLSRNAAYRDRGFCVCLIPSGQERELSIEMSKTAFFKICTYFYDDPPNSLHAVSSTGERTSLNNIS